MIQLNTFYRRLIVSLILVSWTAGSSQTPERPQVTPQPESDVPQLAFVVENPSTQLIRATLRLECLAQGVSCGQFLTILPTGLESNIVSPAAWSSDGRQLAFIAGVDRENFDVYLMDVKGGTPINLTHSPEPEYEVAWSPAGDYLAFSREVIVGQESDLPLRNSELWLMQLEGKVSTKLTEGCCMHWLPQTDGLVYLVFDVLSGLSDLWTIQVDGSNLRNLTHSPLREQEASVTANGQLIAYVAFDPSTEQSHLYLLDRTASVVTDLTPTFKSVGSPTFSPDGTRIAFQSYEAGLGGQLYVIHLADSQLIDLSRLSGKPVGTSDSDPQWISDNQLVFISDRSGSANLYTLRSEGTGLKQILEASFIERGTGLAELSAWP